MHVCACTCLYLMENRWGTETDERGRGLRFLHRCRRMTYSTGLLKGQYEKTRRSQGPRDITKPGFLARVLGTESVPVRSPSNWGEPGPWHS